MIEVKKSSSTPPNVKSQPISHGSRHISPASLRGYRCGK